MNNNAMMMLLPLLFSQKKSGQGSGLSPELLMGLMGNGQAGGNANPMMSMMSMLSGNGNASQVAKPSQPPVNVEEIFGTDVQKMLRIFATMRVSGDE